MQLLVEVVTTTEFMAWAEAHGYAGTATPGVVVGAKRGGRCRRVWQRQPGGWWKIVDKRGKSMLVADDKENDE